VLLRPTVKAILGSLLERPKSLTDLSSETRLTKPALQRHLRDVERLGVITREWRAVAHSREVVYRLLGASLHLELSPPGETAGGTVVSWASGGPEDREFPLTAQVPDPRDRADVASVLRALKRRSRKDWVRIGVVLFGSLVTGRTSRKSDMDLMIVLPSDDPELRERIADTLAEVQVAVERMIQPFFTTREAFRRGERAMDAAARSGVILHVAPEESELWTLMSRYRSISV